MIELSNKTLFSNIYILKDSGRGVDEKTWQEIYQKAAYDFGAAQLLILPSLYSTQ